MSCFLMFIFSAFFAYFIHYTWSVFTFFRSNCIQIRSLFIIAYRQKKNTYVSNEGFVNIYIWAVKTQGKRGGQCGRLCTYVRSGRQRFPNFDARPLHPQRIRELLRAENSIEVMLKKKRTTEEETFISKLFVLFSYTFCAFTNYQEIFFCKTYKTGLLNIGFQICVSKIF